MIFSLSVTQEAHDDTDAIVGYMISELKNPVAADGFLDDVGEGYRNIESNPYMYSVCTDIRLAAMDIRKVVIKNYLILYRIDKSKQNVFVLRIVYGGRDYANMI
jgi:toxin ParE1/3/4